MTFACSAIIVIIIIMSFILTRSGRGYGWSIGILPLLIIPVNYFTGGWSASLLMREFALPYLNALIIVYIFGLALTFLFFAMISLRIANKYSQFSYLFLCGGFSAALTCVFILRAISLN